MRNIDFIVIHCTASAQTAKVDSIVRYWKESLGWVNPGYHYLIEANGSVHNLQPIERASNGVAGFNSNSIHISYIGGIDKAIQPLDNRTPRQVLEMIRLIVELKERFPNARIQGHRDFPRVAKACPSFDVRSWLVSTGLRSLL